MFNFRWTKILQTWKFNPLLPKFKSLRLVTQPSIVIVDIAGCILQNHSGFIVLHTINLSGNFQLGSNFAVFYDSQLFCPEFGQPAVSVKF